MKQETRTKLHQWIEQEYQPWKTKMAEYNVKKQKNMEKLLVNSKGLQSVVGLLLDGEADEAVALWNKLGLMPQLSKVVVDRQREMITLTPTEGGAITLTLSELLGELDKMLG